MMGFESHQVPVMLLLQQDAPRDGQATMASGSNLQERILLTSEVGVAANGDLQVTQRCELQSRGTRSISSLLHLKVGGPPLMKAARWMLLKKMKK
jgi:hypothetical protein